MSLITNITKKNNFPSISRNHVVLHHANCPDGVCAADLIQRVFPQTLAFPLQPKFQMNPFLRNILINKQVFIVDLAVDIEVIQEICDIANYVVFIDHHERDWEFAEVKHDDFFYYYDTQVAACQLTLNLLNMKYHFSEVVAHYIDIVNRYDLHQELADDEHHLIEGWISLCRTNKTPLIPEILDNCYGTLQTKIEINKFGTYIQSEGKKIVQERKIKYDSLCKSLKIIEIEGYKTGVLEYYEKGELANYILENFPDIEIAVVWGKTGNKITSSWRSRSINLIPIVTKYGGGGHMNACGLLLNYELLHNLGFANKDLLNNYRNLKHQEATNYTFFIFTLFSYLYENICDKI